MRVNRRYMNATRGTSFDSSAKEMNITQIIVIIIIIIIIIEIMYITNYNNNVHNKLL